MLQKSDISVVTTKCAPFAATSVNHARLIRTEPIPIRIFLRLYSQEENEVTGGAPQQNAKVTTSEAARSVSLKFCAHPEKVESPIALGFD